MTRTVTEVVYHFPPAYASARVAQQADSRNPQRAADGAPRGAYAFHFHDIITADAGGIELRSHPLNPSPRHVINPGGTVRTLDEVEALPGDNAILLANARDDCADRVLYYPADHVRLLYAGDVLIPVPEIPARQSNGDSR